MPHDTRGSYFIPGLLEHKNKHIEVADRDHVMTKQKGELQMKMCNNNGDPFIATLHKVLLAPDLCVRLFLIITLLNLGHICLFQKLFCTVYFGANDNNAVTLPHSSQKEHVFLRGKRKCQKQRKTI